MGEHVLPEVDDVVGVAVDTDLDGHARARATRRRHHEPSLRLSGEPGGAGVTAHFGGGVAADEEEHQRRDQENGECEHAGDRRPPIDHTIDFRIVLLYRHGA